MEFTIFSEHAEVCNAVFMLAGKDVVASLTCFWKKVSVGAYAQSSSYPDTAAKIISISRNRLFTARLSFLKGGIEKT